MTQPGSVFCPPVPWLCCLCATATATSCGPPLYNRPWPWRKQAPRNSLWQSMRCGTALTSMIAELHGDHFEAPIYLVASNCMMLCKHLSQTCSMAQTICLINTCDIQALNGGSTPAGNPLLPSSSGEEFAAPPAVFAVDGSKQRSFPLTLAGAGR